MKLDFYQLDIVDQRQLKFAVISAIYKGKWVYVRHKDRTTWEIAGGHREFGETWRERPKESSVKKRAV